MHYGWTMCGEVTSGCYALFDVFVGSCADILHSVKQFNNGFHETIISVILRDVIKAVNYLHSLGYVHRFGIHVNLLVCVCSVCMCTCACTCT